MCQICRANLNHCQLSVVKSFFCIHSVDSGVSKKKKNQQLTAFPSNSWCPGAQLEWGGRFASHSKRVCFFPSFFFFLTGTTSNLAGHSSDAQGEWLRKLDSVRADCKRDEIKFCMHSYTCIVLICTKKSNKKQVFLQHVW